MNTKKIYLSVLIVMINISTVFSQEETTPFTIPNRNTITLRTSLFSFFDGNPIIQAKHSNMTGWLINSAGMGYTRKMKRGDYWSVLFDYYGYSLLTDPSELAIGTYYTREFLTIKGTYLHSFYSQKKNQLLWSLGLSFRGGSEDLFANYLPINDVVSEIKVISKTLLDAGLTFGIHHHLYATQHLRFSSSLEYTIYPYTFDGKSDFYDWDKGPTWNMLGLSFAVGFNCGK